MNRYYSDISQKLYIFTDIIKGKTTNWSVKLTSIGENKEYKLLFYLKKCILNPGNLYEKSLSRIDRLDHFGSFIVK